MSLRLNKTILVRIASFMIITYPLVFRYESGVPYITFGEVIIFIVSLLVICHESGVIRFEKNTVIFIVCIIARAFLSFLIDTASIDSIGTGIRLAVLYCFILILLPCFDRDKAKKYLDFVSFIVSVYAFIQLLAAQYHVYLTASLPLLTPIRDVDGEVLIKAGYGVTFRPTSILGEPGELAAYLALPLSLNLLDDSRKKGWLAKSVFFSIALVATLSSTGIALLGIIWMLYFVKSKRTQMKCFVFFLCVVVGGYGFFGMGLWDYFLNRVFGGNGLSGITSNTHYKDMSYLFGNANRIFFVIGRGLNEPAGFLSGAFRLYYYMGIVGLIVYGAFAIAAYKKGTKLQKELLFIWIILNFGGAYMLGSYALPYSLFICGSEACIILNQRRVHSPPLGAYKLIPNEVRSGPDTP